MSQDKRKPEAEPQTYELADPDDVPRVPSPQPVTPKANVKSSEAATYALDEVPEPAKPRSDGSAEAKLAKDPRFAPPPPPPEKRSALSASSDPSKPKVMTSVYTPEAAEPEYVSPEVAARKREEARVRATALATEADAKRRKRNAILIAVVVVIAAAAYGIWRLT